MTLRRVLISLLAIATFGVLECGGDKPLEPQIQKPKITQFTATPTDILAGDSTLATYTAVGADSLVLIPTGTKLGNTNSGSLYLKPALPTRFTLFAYNSAGSDSASLLITMSSHSPLLSFALSEDTIVIGDSTELLFSAFREDSIVIAGIGKVTPADSGSRYIKPNTDTTYTAIAYGQYGADTATVTVRVEVPYQIQAVNGKYYKGSMGSNTLSPEMKFRVVDFSAALLYKSWIHFIASNGDGSLSVDSLPPSSDGTASLTYDFTGVLGRVTVAAIVRDFDTTWVDARASVLTPGANGQGQYVLFSDKYGSVRAYNGEPASIDADPKYCIMYANYELAKGVVVVLEDSACDRTVTEEEPVVGVIVNSVYAGKTIGGIGVGSTYTDVTTAYGQPDSVYLDPVPPPALTMEYWGLGMTYYCGPTDSVVFEIHFTELVANAATWSESLERSSRQISNLMTRFQRKRH